MAADFEVALTDFLNTPEGPGKLRDVLTSADNDIYQRLMNRSGNMAFSYTDIFDVAGIVDGSPPIMRPANQDASPGRDDWLYSEHARGLTGCPYPLDLRVDCSGGGLAGNYTETSPVWIVVHEVRTRTVAAVQSR